MNQYSSTFSFLILLVASIVFNNNIFAQSSETNLIIVEIMKNPFASSDAEGEWFELLNIGSTDINIQNWIIKDEDNDLDTLKSETPLIIEAGSYFVLASNGDTDLNGGFVPDFVYNTANFNLANGSDEILLQNSEGEEVASLAYSDDTFPDPNGASLVFTGDDFGQYFIGGQWEESQFREEGFMVGSKGDLGSPGAEGSQQGSFSVGIENEGDGPIQMDPLILLYPNPSSGISYLVSKGFDATIFVTNSAGQKVLEAKALADMPTEVDLRDYSSGIYFILVRTPYGDRTEQLVLTTR